MRRIRQPESLPAVGSLLNQAGYQGLQEDYPHALVADAIREQLAQERESGVVRPRHLLDHIVPFKRPVYEAVLKEFDDLVK